MSSKDSFENNVTNIVSAFKWYISKQDLVLDNPQELICHLPLTNKLSVLTRVTCSVTANILRN